ncbi:MAG: Rrf2 family transcriptional regulator [Lachnospiraceae bacterium]|nr:Rrf2 family transcriptional regulator [Lachnospiraceae bacterium]
MMISTRGRYALRVMIDIASNQGDGYVPMKDVAARQGLSLKYLEQIIPPLKDHGLIKGIQGKGGGYRLTKNPSEYNIGEILRLTEKDMAPVSCLAEGAPECERRQGCKTVKLWEGLEKVTNEYLDSKTLDDLL